MAEAWKRDPDASLFTPENLQRVIGAAKAQPGLAAALARFALELRPNSLPLHLAAADALFAAGENGAAADVIRRCVSLDVPGNDWRAAAASAACRERAAAGRATRQE